MSEHKTRLKSKKKKVPESSNHDVQVGTVSDIPNREIGWLQFNRRVLAEAEDSRNPLLERVRFLAICSSNLDEFFMKRVGGLKAQVNHRLFSKRANGETPQSLLAQIRQFVMKMIEDQNDCWLNQIKPALQEHRVVITAWNDLSEPEKEKVKVYYQKNVFPVLTPLSVDPGHPFPFISNLSMSLGVTLRHPEKDEKMFARIKVPQLLPQWIKVETQQMDQVKFVNLIDVIKANLADLFPSMKILNTMAFRLTRNANMDRDEEDVEDLLELVEEELKQRRFANVVRLEHGAQPDPWMLQFLMDELEISSEDVYEMKELSYQNLNLIADLPLKKLRFESFAPAVPLSFTEEGHSFFQQIKSADQLLHHPFESFVSSVEKFIRTAADDPKVLAIKMTLYRTGDKSPFIQSLIQAAEQGKNVVCLIELKARFDEERNIYWAQELESAGVHVVYGVLGLKTHAKTALVVRQEPEGLRCYAHIGTGNYNSTTARLYTDVGLLTAREEITRELVDFFNYLTGISLKSNYQNLLIAPINMLSRFKEMILREAAHAEKGLPGQVIAKFNNMEENEITKALYIASQKGVEIDLIVRGFCCLRSGVPGLSDKIRVTSIIGRFLEHSRIFYFRNGSQDPIDGDFYIGSADWMYRNLHARVEAIVPILDRNLKEKCWEILQIYLLEKRQAWKMLPDGTYRRDVYTDEGVHQKLIQLAQQRVKFIEEIVSDDEG